MSESSKILKKTAYECTDGKLFEDYQKARKHQTDLDQQDRVQKLIDLLTSHCTSAELDEEVLGELLEGGHLVIRPSIMKVKS